MALRTSLTGIAGELQAQLVARQDGGMEMLAARLAEALGEHRRDVATQLWQHRDSTNTVGLAVRRAEEAALAAQQQAQEAQQALVHVSQMANSGTIDEQSAQIIAAGLAAR